MKKALLFVSSLGLLLGCCELLFRGIGYDFAGSEKAWQATPPFYRKPTVPLGEVFFHRPGPQSWTGPVISTQMQLREVLNVLGEDEASVTIDYDADGFRNPRDPSDWEIVVVGDSFTELGYLPQDELFTSRLGQHLGVGVRNLGTSFTGPWTHLSYLKNFGVGEATKTSVLVFFEGNDLRDLQQEQLDLDRWRAGGGREYREIPRQSSPTRALLELLSSVFDGPSQPFDPVNAFFLSEAGEVPVSLHYTPPSRAQVEDATAAALWDFLDEYDRFSRSRGLEPWLAYMPSKHRVLEGRLRFTEDADAELQEWSPTDLPRWIAELCQDHGIRFVDLTPALAEGTRAEGRLLYNGVFDTHLNAAGAEVVARVLAEQLAHHRR